MHVVLNDLPFFVGIREREDHIMFQLSLVQMPMLRLVLILQHYEQRVTLFMMNDLEMKFFPGLDRAITINIHSTELKKVIFDAIHLP